jgi:hypothetical protein
LAGITGYSQKRLGLPEIGGILTPAISASYHVFTKLRENPMNIGDFYDIFYRNCFNSFA